MADRIGKEIGEDSRKHRAVDIDRSRCGEKETALKRAQPSFFAVARIDLSNQRGNVDPFRSQELSSGLTAREGKQGDHHSFHAQSHVADLAKEHGYWDLFI